MFTIKLKNSSLGHVDFKGEKCLVNKLFKYRSLGEMVALARANGERPLPTRNGVYTGEMSIPVETFDKINLRNKMMEDTIAAENQYSDAMAQLNAEKQSASEAEFRKKVIQEYEASLESSTTK